MGSDGARLFAMARPSAAASLIDQTMSLSLVVADDSGA